MIGSVGSDSAERVIKLSDEEPEAFGYWVDLDGQEFDDNTATWIQAMPYGTYQHPIYGKIEINTERAKRFAANVKSNVRGQDLDIDYDHKERSGEAAGWVKDAEARQDGLWLLVEWTKTAARQIRERAYRYFSPEFVDSWTHPSTRQKHKDVLFGGALTNRPFLKGILPINLSELTEGGNNVDRDLLERLAKRLKVEFDDKVTDEDLQAKIDEASKQEPEKETESPKDDKETTTEPPTMEDKSTQPVAASERLKKLAESDPEIAAILAEQQANADRIARLEVSSRLSEVNLQLTQLSDPSNDLVIAPKHVTKLRETVVGLPKEAGDAVLKLFKEMLADGLVPTGETGGRPRAQKFDDPVTEFTEKVTKLTEGNEKLSYADAVTRLSDEEPELFAAYRSASYAENGED
jgi:hypothetical protein